MRKNCAAVIVAAGSAARMQGIDKMLVPLAGVPVVLRSAQALAACAEIDSLVIVTRKELVGQVTALCAGVKKLKAVVPGGASRAESVLAGLDALLARYGYVRDGKIYRYEESNSATIALFCHFGLGMAMISHLIGVSLTALWQGFLMPTSSVTTFVSEERIPGEAYFRCIQRGDTSHLYAAHEPISSAGLLKAEL